MYVSLSFFICILHDILSFFAGVTVFYFSDFLFLFLHYMRTTYMLYWSFSDTETREIFVWLFVCAFSLVFTGITIRSSSYAICTVSARHFCVSTIILYILHSYCVLNHRVVAGCGVRWILALFYCIIHILIVIISVVSGFYESIVNT